MGVLECLSCILRILNGYSLVPTSHLYVPIMFPTLNWADQLAHFSSICVKTLISQSLIFLKATLTDLDTRTATHIDCFFQVWTSPCNKDYSFKQKLHYFKWLQDKHVITHQLRSRWGASWSALHKYEITQESEDAKII